MKRKLETGILLVLMFVWITVNVSLGSLTLAASAQESPGITIKPIGDTGIEFTLPEDVTDLERVVGTIHVRPTNGPEEVRLYVPGVKEGDSLSFYIYTSEGTYVEIEGYVAADNTVVVTITQEGDLVIIFDPETENEPGGGNAEGAGGGEDTDTQPGTSEPVRSLESPPTGDGSPNSAIPASMCGVFAVMAFIFLTRSKKRRICAVMALILCGVCGFWTASLLSVRRHEYSILEAMQKISQKTVMDGELTVDSPIDFKALQKENPDIYAWLTVPGTKVDYPIVQRTKDNDYYLSNNYDEETSDYGAIYSEFWNKKDFEDPMTVIYGYDMNDETMFGSLYYFQDKEFFDKHREFVIYTEDYTFHYLIFAAYEYTNEHILNCHDFEDEKEYQDYLDLIYSFRSMKNYFLEDPVVETEDYIVTLSTCTDSEHSYRYLVQGVLTEVEE